MRIYRTCMCKHNYTYKERTRRRQVTVAPACRTNSRRVLLDNAPVGRTDEQTDAHIPVIVLSQEEAGFVLSASLAFDSYRKTFPTQSPSLIFFSLSRPLLFSDMRWADTEMLCNTLLFLIASANIKVCALIV